MSQKTDYKKLWRKSSNENTKLHNELGKANEIIEIQGKMIKELSRKGKKEIK